MPGVAVSIDMGGTNLRVAIVDEKGEILFRILQPTKPERGRSKVFASLTEGIKEVMVKAKAKGLEPLGVGIGFPGVFADDGVILGAPQLPDWVGFAFLDALREAIEIPVFVENDANCAALGEYWIFRGDLPDTFVFMTLGSGIGGGVILQGKLWRGYLGSAGEIGHIPVEPNGPFCGGGHQGCIEVFSSAVGLKNLIGRVLDEGITSPFLSAFKDRSPTVTPKDAYEAAKQDDFGARRLFERFGEYLGIALASVVNVLNPPAIVIGGNIANAWEFFAPSILPSLKRHTFPYVAERLKIRKAGLGEDAGILGAASLIFVKEACLP
jgi:glucokinase